MNYYTLPKIHNKSNLHLHITNESNEPFISNTLLNYYNKLIHEINEIQFYNSNSNTNTNTNTNTNANKIYDEVIKIVNP